MKIVPAIIALGLAGVAHAGPASDEMSKIRAAEYWSGCVYQQGFDPYPIRISPRPAPTLKVDYPGLCSGYHTPRQKGWPNDAVEVITGDVGTCIETVELDYSFENGLLRIDFLIGDSAFALLRPAEKDAKPHACNPGEAIS